MTRKRVTIILSSAVIFILAISALALWRNRGQARVDKRLPLQGLAYCSSRPTPPCVVSFSLDVDGNLLVNFLTEGAFYPDFYLKVRAGENEHIYVCKKVNTFATTVYCTGKVLPVGEVLQFFLLSLNGDILLAQGNFPIIGMALAGPEIFVSPTPAPSYPSYPNRIP